MLKRKHEENYKYILLVKNEYRYYKWNEWMNRRMNTTQEGWIKLWGMKWMNRRMNTTHEGWIKLWGMKWMNRRMNTTYEGWIEL